MLYLFLANGGQQKQALNNTDILYYYIGVDMGIFSKVGTDVTIGYEYELGLTTDWNKVNRICSSLGQS